MPERSCLTHVATSRPELLPSSVIAVSAWEALLETCDALIIASPPASHAAIVQGCLTCGIPCIVEKPLCLDLTSVEALAARPGLVLVDYIQLFSPAYRALKSALRNAEELPFRIVSEGGWLGPFRDDTSVLWDYGPHELSLLLDLAGGPPVALSTLPDSDRGQWALRMEFAGGLCCWSQFGSMTPSKRRTLSVYTESRLYHWDDTQAPQTRLTVSEWSYRKRRQGQAAIAALPIPIGDMRTPLQSMLDYFLDGLEGGDRSRFGLELSLQITRVLERCEALSGF
jgi:predicted dehydrogenase